jgi:hypothetical protein
VLLLYFGPLVAGGIMVLFMIKPLFARAPKKSKPLAIDPRSEPLLFEFVERICKLVGAPVPREIRVDCNANASASFRHGFWSMLGNDLTLTIGLPLAAGLDLRQFAGVLAHEFGHFAQHAGMRMTYIIRAVNLWFIRVVYERDAWDEALTQWSKDIDIRIGIVFYLARFFVWLTRKILWVLMAAGHGVSCFMLRQMEFDADSYEIQLAGTAAFESTFERMTLISVASRSALQSLQQSWSERRLPDDLTALTLNTLKQIPAEALEKIKKLGLEKKTGFFDTHPADKDRIAAGRRENARGIFHVTSPVTTIFQGFDDISRKASFEFYRDALGTLVKKENIRPVAEFIGEQDREQEAQKVLVRYFQDCVSPLRALRLPAIVLQPPQMLESGVASVRNAREAMLGARKEYADSLKKYDDADTCVLNCARASTLLTAKLKIKPADFGLSRGDSSGVSSQRMQAEGAQRLLDPQLTAFETAAGERLLGALGLLRLPEIAGKVEDAPAVLREVETLLPVTVHVGRQLPDLLALRNDQQSLMVLFANIKGNEENASLIAAVRSTARNMQRKLRSIQGSLGDVAYPFEHGRGKVTIKEFALRHVPLDDDIGEIARTSDEVLDRLFNLYFRLVGRLTLAAEKVETAAGLEPLADPPPRPTSPEKS